MKPDVFLPYSAVERLLVKELWPADIVLTRSDSWLARWIRAAEVLQSGDALVNHAAGVVGQGQKEVIESLWRVRRTLIADLAGQHLVVWRHRHLEWHQREAIVDRWREREGALYGCSKIPLMLGDAVIGPITGWMFGGEWANPFTRLFAFLPWIVCSQFIAWGYDEELGLAVFGRPWREITPDDIDDWCYMHPGSWELIHDHLPERG